MNNVFRKAVSVILWFLSQNLSLFLLQGQLLLTPALCCPTLGNSVPRRRLLPTLSVSAPLCPCCTRYASARRPPGARGPAARRGCTGLGPGVLRHPGGGDGPWTRLHAPNRAPPGPGNDGKPRTTLGAPFSRAERGPRPSCPHAFSVRILKPRQLLSARAELRGGGRRGPETAPSETKTPSPRGRATPVDPTPSPGPRHRPFKRRAAGIG